MSAPITQGRLKELVSYCALDGVFIWLSARGGMRAGTVAGRTMWDGHRRICIDGREYLAHRLAWLYVKGEFPALNLDHINGNPDDNRIDNLRETTQAQNTQNQRKAHRTKRDGALLGAYWHKRARKWCASISVNKRLRHLGYFGTEAEAHEAYLNAKRELHEFSTV